jgi:hypothetical protein
MSPIAYFVFNRPEITERTFAEIRKQRPSQLFIIADGPRPAYKDDIDRCSRVRALLDTIDWPCDVHRNYSDINLGLKHRVSSGLDWVFSKVDSAIILEDDCLPCPDFFNYCDELLERYSNDERVSVITGNNFQGGHKRGNASYYFSKYNHCWGWATWRRAWLYYHADLSFWPKWKSSDEWLRLTPDSAERRYWNNIFEQVRSKKINSWAYPWTGSVWFRGGLTATPNVNLVSNIGFGSTSTHTNSTQSSLAEMNTSALGNIIHPNSVVQHVAADHYVFTYVFGGHLQGFPYILFKFPRMMVGKFFRMIKKMADNA